MSERLIKFLFWFVVMPFFMACILVERNPKPIFLFAGWCVIVILQVMVENTFWPP